MTGPVPFAPILKAVLESEGGQEFLRWYLMDICGCLRSPMASSDRDVNYLCGKQDAGYVLLDLLLETQPQALATLMEDRNAKS